MLNSLERKLNISVPTEEIDSEVQKRLKDLSKKVKIDGFRPGKVPFNIVQKHYQGPILNEVLEDKIRTSYFSALQKENLQPATLPHIESMPYQSGKPFNYTAVFEIYPTINLGNFTELEVEKIVTEITEQDINDMIEVVRKQFASWNETDKASEDGDRVVIDFNGTINGEPFKNNSGQNQEIILGTKNYHPDFVKNLYGIKAKENVKFKVAYPDNYGEAELANKEADFAVEIKKVLHPELPEINAEIVKKMGVKSGNVDDLKAEIRKNMQREIEQRLQKHFRDAVLNKLVEKNPVEIPKSLLANEMARLKQEEVKLIQQYIDRFKLQNKESLPKMDETKLEANAKRNTAMSLLLGEIVKKFNIQLDKDRVRKKIEDLASSYENSEKAIAWYYKNEEELKHINFVVLEDQILEQIEKEVKVTEKKMPYKEALTYA